jgi:MFS family permease
MAEPRPPRPPGDHHDDHDPSEVVTEAIHALRDHPEDRPGMHVRIFGSRAFFRLWVAQVVTSMGDWLGFLAIVVLAQRIGSSAPGASVGLVMAARIVPGFFFAAGAGVLIDRMDRKQVMVVTNVIRAGVVFTLPWVDSVLGLVFASLILELATLLFTPAKEAAVPSLVPPEHLTTANSLSLAAAYGTFPVAAGLFALLSGLASWLGGFSALEGLGVSQESLAFYANVVTYLVAALVITTLPIAQDHLRAREADRDASLEVGGVFAEIKEGWSFIFINPVVRAVNVGLATGLIGGGMLVPLGPVFIGTVLGGSTAGFGFFLFALGVGVAIGVVAVSLLQKRLPKRRVFPLAVVLSGVSLFMAASVSTLLLSALFVTVMGIFAGCVYVLGFTLLHENVDDELRGRVFSGLYTLVRLCVLLAFAVGGPISDLLDGLSRRLFDRSIGFGPGSIAIPGVRLTLWLAAVIMVAAGILAILSLRAGSAGAGRPSQPGGADGDDDEGAEVDPAHEGPAAADAEPAEGGDTDRAPPDPALPEEAGRGSTRPRRTGSAARVRRALGLGAS